MWTVGSLCRGFVKQPLPAGNFKRMKRTKNQRTVESTSYYSLMPLRKGTQTFLTCARVITNWRTPSLEKWIGWRPDLWYFLLTSCYLVKWRKSLHDIHVKCKGFSTRKLCLKNWKQTRKKSYFFHKKRQNSLSNVVYQFTYPGMQQLII